MRKTSRPRKFLRVSSLISLPDHGCPAGKKEQGQEIADLLSAQGKNLLFVCSAFFTAVPAVVVRSAVKAELTVGLIVAFIVRYEVGQCKAFIACHIAEDAVLRRCRQKQFEEILHDIIITFDKSAKESLEIVFAGDQPGKIMKRSVLGEPSD